METFAEAWVAANTQTPLTEAAEAQVCSRTNLNNPQELGVLLGQASLPPSACIHDLTTERREKQEGNGENGGRATGLRSPAAGTCLATLADFRGITTKLPTGKSIPIHCVVEQIQSCSQGGEPVELDSYAIVPGTAVFSDLVRTALIKLGYSSSEAVGAKGAIHIKNWKPLTLDQITESPEATVADILGELASVATLHIRLYSRPKMNTANEVKEKLLQVLLAQSQTLLINSGCPIDQSILSALSKGRLECDIPDETRKKFDQWYLQQIFQHCRQVALLQQQHHHLQQQQLSLDQGQITTSPGQQQERSNPQSQGRTRIRTSFDPELELPKLHRWFAENQHPSRLQIQQYVKELNSLESRRGRKPLDVNNVVYWFKNARAAHKRAEQKGCAESNGLRSPCLEIVTESYSAGTMDHSTTEEGVLISRPGSSEERRREIDSGRYSGVDSHSESQPNSSDDSDNAHTLDLSVRRPPSDRCSNGNCSPLRSSPQELKVKEEPKDSSSEHSMDSSESGEEDIDIMDDVPMEKDEQDLPIVSHSEHEISESSRAHQNGLLENSSPLSQRREEFSAFGSGTVGNLEERRKRNRTFIDPVTEVPRLEQWFSINTHPAHSQIVRYTQELNGMPYRQKFPKLEPKNIQFWFKNRRAKCKRLNLAALHNSGPCSDKLLLPTN